MKLTLTSWIAKTVCVLGICSSALATPQHGVALYGTPKYPSDFQAFDYVNPDAPKGGSLVEASFSVFDTLNPFVINGIAPDGIGLTHDTLMKQSADEAFSVYGLIANSIDISPDRSQVRFTLNPAATFSDGSPITSADVAFSFHILRDRGVPTYRAYYRDVLSLETPDAQTVVFNLSPHSNRELPLILGELPVLSKAYWQGRNFTKTTLDIPVSSGSYIIEKIVPNRSITYRRNPTYWATNLNTNRGMNNFDTIRFDIYRDSTVAVEAFKAGLIDIRLENEAKKWHILQADPLVKEGKVIARTFPHHQPSGMQGFVFNLRRPIFQDILVREALTLVFDFNWTNHSLFFDSYTRTHSYFDNSFLKATDYLPADEYSLLRPLTPYIPSRVFTEKPPYFFPSPSKRDNLRYALSLLNQALSGNGLFCPILTASVA